MKTKIISASIALVFLSAFVSLKAQSFQPGATMVGIGVGYSDLTKYLYNGSYNYSSNGTQPTLELPELSATLDYFVVSNYSIGLGVAYQNLTGSGVINTGLYPYTPESFTENVSRVNISVRSIFYFTKDMRPNFYGGVCIGYEYFNYNFSPINPYTVNTGNNNYQQQQPLTAPTIQAFVGVRARITDGFSTYFELGSGIPFYAEIGFSINFGGKPVEAAPAPPGPGGPPPYMH